MRRARELEATEPGSVGRRFIDGTRPSLEALVFNLADEIAYNTHDIDDGVRSGLLVYEQLLASPLFLRFHREALAEFPNLGGTQPPSGSPATRMDEWRRAPDGRWRSRGAAARAHHTISA